MKPRKMINMLIVVSALEHLTRVERYEVRPGVSAEVAIEDLKKCRQIMLSFLYGVQWVDMILLRVHHLLPYLRPELFGHNRKFP